MPSQGSNDVSLHVARKERGRRLRRFLTRPAFALKLAPDNSYSAQMPEIRKVAKYTLDAALIFVPLAVVLYFLAYQDKFNTFLNWMIGHHQ